MFEILWNNQRLWNKHIYLILVSSFVLEADSIPLLRSFLTSEKTKILFNAISLSEKQKYMQFMIYSFQQNWNQDEEEDSRLHSNDYSSVNLPFSPMEKQNIEQINLNNFSEKDKTRKEIDHVVLHEFVTCLPFSLVHLTDNLLPLHLSSTLQDLLATLE